MIPIAVAAMGAAFYAYGVRAHHRRYPRRPFPRFRSICFGAGSLVLCAAFSPIVEQLVDRTFAAHMVQHLLMTMVAAPLLLLGAPDRLALAAAPMPLARRIAAILRSPAVHFATSPVAAWSGFALIMWSAHVSPLYEVALENAHWHIAEHGLFFVGALLFWYPVIGASGTSPSLWHPGRLLYVFLAMPPSAFLGLAIFESRRVLYPHYLMDGRVAAQVALADQRTGGAIMWIAGGFVMFIALLLIAADWARAEMRLAARIDAQLDAASEVH